MQSFRLFASADKDTMSLQSNVRDFAADVSALALLDYVILKDIDLITATNNKIQHKLNRPVIGYIVVRKDAQADIWDVPTANNLSNFILTLQCSANCKVSILLF